MLNHKPPYRLALAGSTEYTADLAKILATDDRFTIIWVMSPTTKSVGRKPDLIDNPLHLWAVKHTVPSIRVANKIDQKVKQEIESLNSDIDILLVVDFGYFVPEWLVELSKVAPLNLHPSKLPEWRGSSPGQAVLLSGAQTSAITLMQIDKQLDHGPIIFQQSFDVSPTWTQVEYYQTAFASISTEIGNLIEQFILGKLVPTTQPDTSPTPIARELTKADSYLPWQLVLELMSATSQTSKMETLDSQLPPFLADIWEYLNVQSNSSDSSRDTATPSVSDFIAFIARAARALSPWPQLWTRVPTTKGERRLKILSIDPTITDRLVLKQVQLEGQQPALWNQIKNSVLNLEHTQP